MTKERVTLAPSYTNLDTVWSHVKGCSWRKHVCKAQPVCLMSITIIVIIIIIITINGDRGIINVCVFLFQVLGGPNLTFTICSKGYSQS